MFTKIKDRLSSQLQGLTKVVRSKIFGANNERLDLLMDSFYGLSDQQRMGVFIASGLGGLVLVAAILFGYFSRVEALDSELSASFNAIHDLRRQKNIYEQENRRYRQMIRMVSQKTRDLRIKPFFEEKAQKIGVSLQDLNDQTTPMPAENYMSNDAQYVNVDLRLPKISIPRLMNFIVDVEKSNNFLSVQDLQIRGRYGTKLYFDAQAKFKGYSLGGR